MRKPATAANVEATNADAKSCCAIELQHAVSSSVGNRLRGRYTRRGQSPRRAGEMPHWLPCKAEHGATDFIPGACKLSVLTAPIFIAEMRCAGKCLSRERDRAS